MMYLRIYQELTPISYPEHEKGKISKSMNSFLHESLYLQPAIILIIFFCDQKIFMLSGEFPQNNSS